MEIEKWSNEKGLVKGKSADIRFLNTFPERIRGRIIGCYLERQINKVLITVTALKNKFLMIDEKEYSFMSLIDYHNDVTQNILEWGTLKNYHTTEKIYFNVSQRKTQDLRCISFPTWI